MESQKIARPLSPHRTYFKPTLTIKHLSFLFFICLTPAVGNTALQTQLCSAHHFWQDWGDLLLYSLEHNGYHWTGYPFLSSCWALSSLRLITARERALNRTVTRTRYAWLSNNDFNREMYRSPVKSSYFTPWLLCRCRSSRPPLRKPSYFKHASWIHGMNARVSSRKKGDRVGMYRVIYKFSLGNYSHIRSHKQ